MGADVKPPLGVKPLRIYALPRIQGLAHAIYGCAVHYEEIGITPKTISLMAKWASELNGILCRMKG